MAVDEGDREHSEEELVAHVARGTLTAEGVARLEPHLASCSSCVAELEAVRTFHLAVAPGPDDQVLDQVAVEGALGRLTEGAGEGDLARRRWVDDALDRAAVDRVMAVLGEQDARAARRGRLQRRVAGFAAAGVAAAAAIVLFAGQPRRPQTSDGATAGTAAARPLILADGSEVIPDGSATPVLVKEQTAARTVVRLPSGAARFRVKHDARRLFRVDAGPVAIEDLGTVFRVAHEADGRVRVVVSEGRVAVLSSAGGARVELGAGDERVFSAGADRAPLAAGRAGSMPEAALGSTPLAETPAVPSPSPGPAAAAASSSAAAAPVPLRGQARARSDEDPAELLAAADVARRSRDPRAAIGPLRRLVQRHPKDPRAPSAAFTLGWVLLTDLDRPRAAAAAFADAERLAPRGALAEDAAARVAEAWQSAGDSRRAAEAARRYEEMYPTGRYIGLMRGLNGKHDGTN